MPWSESDYHRHADAYLESLFGQLEEQDSAGALEMDLEGGVLTIAAGGGVFIVNKHAASQEIWLSSPLSGGLHFTPEGDGRDWKLKDGRRLSVVLAEELGMATEINFTVTIKT